MSHLQWLSFVNTSSAPWPLPCFWGGTVKARLRFILSSSYSATSPRGRAGPREGSTVKPHTRHHGASITHLQAFKVPLNRTFEPAEEKVLLNCLVGRAEFIQMGELAETTEQIPTTKPFHASEKRERNGRGGPKQTGFGKLEAVGWNFQLFLFSSHSFLGSLLHSEKQRLSTFTLLGFSLLQKKGAVRSQSQNKHCFQHHQHSFPGVWAFCGGLKGAIFFQRSLCCWDSLSLSFCGLLSILVFIFSSLSLSLSLSYSSRKESHFLFLSPEYAET